MVCKTVMRGFDSLLRLSLNRFKSKDSGESERVLDELTASIPENLASRAASFRESAREIDQRRARASQGGETPVSGELEWAKEKGRLIAFEDFELLGGPISNDTSEHEVWRLGREGRAVKRSWPGFFGQDPILWKGQIRMKNATLPDYLRRMALHVALFGSDIRFEGITVSDKPSMMIVQIDLNNSKSPLVFAAMNPPPAGPPLELDPLERQMVAVFVDGVRVLGLPRSIGEIYGLLFISRSPLSLDDLVLRLQISKGSVSQGLRMLKSLGAVSEANGNGNGSAERRTYYEPAVELKRLVGGFIREQIRPHLESGKTKISQLARTANEVADLEHRQFLSGRVERLDQWMRSGSKVLPLLQKILGQ